LWLFYPDLLFVFYFMMSLLVMLLKKIIGFVVIEKVIVPLEIFV